MIGTVTVFVVSAEQLGPASGLGVVAAGGGAAVLGSVEHAHVGGHRLAQRDREVHLPVGLARFDVRHRGSGALADLLVVVDGADPGGLLGPRSVVPVQPLNPVDVGVQRHRLAAVLDRVVDYPDVHALFGLVPLEAKVGDVLPLPEVVVRVRVAGRDQDAWVVVLVLGSRALLGAQRHLDPVSGSCRWVDRDVELQHVRIADVPLPAARGVLVPLVRRGVADLEAFALIDHLDLFDWCPEPRTITVHRPHLEWIGGVRPRVRHVDKEALVFRRARNRGPIGVGALLQPAAAVLVPRDRAPSHTVRLLPEHRHNGPVVLAATAVHGDFQEAGGARGAA